jgi:hypothetical protein
MTLSGDKKDNITPGMVKKIEIKRIAIQQYIVKIIGKYTISLCLYFTLITIHFISVCQENCLLKCLYERIDKRVTTLPKERIDIY